LFALAAAFLSTSAPADVVIPSSAFSAGANNAEFHTDVRIFNPTTTPVAVTPIFYNQAAGGTAVGSVPPTLVIPPRTQVQYDNALSSLFGLPKGVFGPIRFQTTAALVVSSGVNNVNACGNGSTSGQWLPGIDQSLALRSGTLIQLAASADAGSGYRSNVVFTNPGTVPATVQTNLRKGDGTLISSATIGPLGASGWTQIGGLSAWLPSPNTITDTNLWLEFTSDQPVLSFASVINNASGDPFAIVMTAEPNVSTSAPLASYTISPANPQPNDTVVFTDTSTGGVVNRFWVFGDGSTKVAADPVTTKLYGSAGTYKTWLFVDNAFGANSTTKDVVVGTAAPIAVTISATTTGGTKWTYVCQSPVSVCSGAGNNNVNLKVGQAYRITWTTPSSENTMHGAGAAALGLLCDVIRSVQPCSLDFTPAANMLNVPGPVYTYACTQSTCGAGHNNMTGTITIVP
jgi:PKD repeat protein